jgi:hypothetical protein
MYRKTESREGQALDYMIEVILLVWCTLLAPYGIDALSALPVLPGV